MSIGVMLMGAAAMTLADAVESTGAHATKHASLGAIPDSLPRCVFVAGDDAPALLDAWRSDPRSVNVPVIAVVAHPAERLFRDALVAGADDAIVEGDRGGAIRRLATLATVPEREAARPRARVAVIDPDATRRRRVARALRRGGLEPLFASALEELGADSAEVVVVHESLGDGDVHHRVRDQTGAHALPVVVVVEADDTERGGRRVERTATVPSNAPAAHLLFVINELLAPGADEHRASPRLLFATLCSYRRARELSPSFGVSYNISRGGVFIRTLDPPAIADEVWIELRPPHAVGAVHLRGAVRWRSHGGTTPPGFAVEWLNHMCPPFDVERYREQYRRLLDEPQAYGGGQTTMSLPAVSRPAKASRILIADDDELVRKTMARIFRNSDFAVTLANDGEHAVELFRAERHDAVITDIHMPKLTGIELLKAIRADDDDVPVIITTGQPSVQTAVDALAHGALQYLVKPVDVDRLREAVQQAVNMGRLARFRRQAALLAVESHDGEAMSELDAALTRAVAHLSAHFQPIVSWPARTVYAYEALARSSEPAIPHPGALFDAAERLGRLKDVGRRMRAIAPAPFRDGDGQLFVNLHPQDLDDEQLYDRSTPLSAIASRVVLELTERASLVSIPDLRDRITRLRAIGFRVAVDDLGAGYAGLSAFCALDPDVVKLDMSLVRGIELSRTKQRIVRSMVTACGELDMHVIAEGVETRAELDALCELGCELFQGYLFARPAPTLCEPSWPE